VIPYKAELFEKGDCKMPLKRNSPVLREYTDFEIIKLLLSNLLREYIHNSRCPHSFEFYMTNILRDLSCQIATTSYYPHPFADIIDEVMNRRSTIIRTDFLVCVNTRLGDLSNEEFMALCVEAVRQKGHEYERFSVHEDEILDLLAILLDTEQRLGSYVTALFEPVVLFENGKQRVEMKDSLALWDIV
jgi:hypothetical protein